MRFADASRGLVQLGGADAGYPLWLVAVVVVGVVLVVGGLLYGILDAVRKRPASAPPPIRIEPIPPVHRLIAVLPFRADTARPDLGALGGGLTVLVRRHLFCIRGMSVLPADATPLGVDDAEVRALYTIAGREALVAGRIEEGPLGVHLSVELRRAASRVTLGPYEGSFDDLPGLSERLSLEVAAALDLSLGRDELRAIESCRPAHASSLMRLGMAMDAGQVSRAMELLEQAIHDDRTFAPLYVELARVVSESSPERAAALLDEAVKLDPDHAVPYWQLALLYIFRFSGRSSQSLALTEQAIARAPAFGQARELHGNFLGLLGAAEEAWERENAIQLLPGSAPAWANHAKVLARRGDPRALAAFERALFIDADHDEALEGIVPVARAQGLPDVALRWAEKRMSLKDPRRSRPLGEEGAGDEAAFLAAAEQAIEAATLVGDRAAVERVAQRALAVDPELKAARRAVARSSKVP